MGRRRRSRRSDRRWQGSGELPIGAPCCTRCTRCTHAAHTPHTRRTHAGPAASLRPLCTLSAPSLHVYMHTLCTRAHLCTPAHPHTPVHLCRGDGAAGEAAAAAVALQTQLAGQAEQSIATLRESLAGLGVSVDGIGSIGSDVDGAEAAAALQAGLILILALAMAQLYQRPPSPLPSPHPPTRPSPHPSPHPSP